MAERAGGEEMTVHSGADAGRARFPGLNTDEVSKSTLMSSQGVLCRLSTRGGLLVALGLLLLLILWLLRAWLWILLAVYLALIILVGLIGLALLVQRALVKICWKSQADPKGVGSEGHPKSNPVYVPPTIYKRPDPLIYSQGWQHARGLAVNWDNPDIHLFEVQGPGIPPKPASPHALLPNHPYLIRAQVWNGSLEAPAVNMPVRFYYLTFGIGTVQTFMAITAGEISTTSATGDGIPEITANGEAAIGEIGMGETDVPKNGVRGNGAGRNGASTNGVNARGGTTSTIGVTILVLPFTSASGAD